MNQSGLNWDRAVSYDAALQRGEVTAYTTRSPLTELLAAESGGATDPDTARSLLLRTIMAYLFSESPHPAHVMHRLYVLAKEACPELLKAVTPAEAMLLLSESDHAKQWRLGVCLRGTRAEGRSLVEHEAIVHRTLQAANHRHPSSGLPVIVALDDVLRLGDFEMLLDYSERMKLLAAGLRFFFAEGPAPELAVVRVFALAKAQFPELIVNMNVRQLGALFGVTGASWSERIKRKFNRFLATRGAQGVRAPFQKSPEACATYSRVQRGNRNRRCGMKRSA